MNKVLLLLVMALNAGWLAHLLRRKEKITGSPFLNVLDLAPAIYVLTKSILYRDTSCLCIDKMSWSWE